MRVATFTKLFLICALFSLLLVPSRASADVSFDQAAKMLPDHLGDFRAQGVPLQPYNPIKDSVLREDGVRSAAVREYASAKGEKFEVWLVQTTSDSAAYALLTSWNTRLNRGEDTDLPVVRTGEVGTASVASGSIAFFKGQTFVFLFPRTKLADKSEAEKALARSLADTLEKGEGELPVLVKHLPDWEKARAHAVYAIGPEALQRALGNQPVLDAVSFEGGAEAVTSTYGQSRLAIIEYTTPQLAADADARIQERIKQLQSEGGPVPTAYRRVGNYSVFVFGAPDERTASVLIEQVSYEQVVQWLGDDPRILQRVQREYVNTMGGTILAVLKASGLSLIVCLGIGGLAGGLVFIRRRAQATAVDAYSDAGGMLRLNLDEMNAQTAPDRMLGRGEG